jgi:hypothetical protein
MVGSRVQPIIPASKNCAKLSIARELTNPMEQSPTWEANSHAASQEIPRLLWNSKVHCHVHRSPSLVPILIQMNPVHILQPYFPTVHSYIILTFTPRSSEWSLPFRFPSETSYAFICLMRAIGPTHHSPWFDLPNNIWWRVKVMKLLISAWEVYKVESEKCQCVVAMSSRPRMGAVV